MQLSLGLQLLVMVIHHAWFYLFKVGFKNNFLTVLQLSQLNQLTIMQFSLRLQLFIEVFNHCRFYSCKISLLRLFFLFLYQN